MLGENNINTACLHEDIPNMSCKECPDKEGCGFRFQVDAAFEEDEEEMVVD